MKIEQVHYHGMDIAVISGGEKVILDASSALDLAMSAQYETGSARLVIEKKLVTEDFFILSTGLAGEILQKYMNYHIKAAFWGDFSRYTSKPLRDFIYESNQGKNFFFAASKEEAMERITKTQ